jgi:hypothetical protein
LIQEEADFARDTPMLMVATESRQWPRSTKVRPKAALRRADIKRSSADAADGSVDDCVRRRPHIGWTGATD